MFTAEFPSCCRSLRKTSERRSTVPRSPSALSVIRIHRGSSLRRNRAGASVLRRCDEGARARPSWSIAPPLCHAFAHHLVASRLGPLSLLSRPLASYATTHIARMPSLLSDTPSHYALSRSVLCPPTSHARTRALSALRHALTLRPLPSHLACAHSCPLCSQTRPLITPSPYALSRSPSRSFTTHACPLTRSYALSPRMHARVPSPLLSGTPSQHYALSRSPFAPSHHACMPSHALLRPALTSHACPLTRSHPISHACPLLSGSYGCMHALSRPLTDLTTLMLS